MDISNPRYKNQGIHVDIAIFTVENSEIKILLVQRRKNPYIGEWILPGGAVYNDESVDYAANRELEEKTGLHDIFIEQFGIFGDPNRDPRMRMVAVAYLAVLDKNKVEILQKTPKTLGAKWWNINKLPKVVFDHKEIILEAIESLRKKMMHSNIVHQLLPNKFTMPELHKVYETILNKSLDRRNFRRKFFSLGLIKKTNQKTFGKQNRPADFYKFTTKIYQEVNIF